MGFFLRHHPPPLTTTPRSAHAHGCARAEGHPRCPASATRPTRPCCSVAARCGRHNRRSRFTCDRGQPPTSKTASCVERPAGLEPATSGLQGRCSNRSELRAHGLAIGTPPTPDRQQNNRSAGPGKNGARIPARWRGHDRSVTSPLALHEAGTTYPELESSGTQRTGEVRPVTGGADTSGRWQAPARRLHIVAWEDPVVESTGVDALGPYVEAFWLPVLGPSATLLLRRLAAGLRASPHGYDLELEETARALGLGGVGGRRSPFRRAILRCARYGIARHQGLDRLAVRRWLTPLPERHLRRLPPSLQAQHLRWTVTEGGRPATIDAVRRRARSLAVELAASDPEQESLERRLVRRGVHPAVAYESATWAARRAELSVAAEDGEGPRST
jgi:hypothetical protein